MISYFHNIWKCRYFWLSLVKMDLRTRYRRSVLGLGWSLLNPIAMTTVICTMVCLTMDGIQWYNHAPYLLAGIACWQYLTTSCLSGAQSFFANEGYIRQQPMPLAIYPLRVVLGATVHFLIATSVVILFVSLFPPGLPEGRAHLSILTKLVLVIPATLIFLVVMWSLAIVMGLINVFFQDTQHLAEVFLQMMFYLTPIIYKQEHLAKRGLAWVGEYNPIAILIDLIRDPLIHGIIPSWTHYLSAVGLAGMAAFMAGGLLVRLQKRLIFHL